MKITHYFILTVIAAASFGCSADQESNPMTITSISFIHADGTLISENECVDPNKKYALKIETTSKSITKGEPLKVDYTVNGAIFNMYFSISGAQINPVTLAQGNNIAQIIGTDYKCSIKYSAQGDFELLD